MRRPSWDQWRACLDSSSSAHWVLMCVYHWNAKHLGPLEMRGNSSLEKTFYSIKVHQVYHFVFSCWTSLEGLFFTCADSSFEQDGLCELAGFVPAAHLLMIILRFVSVSMLTFAPYWTCLTTMISCSVQIR